ncbi:MAG: D-2-hydroxyacid dehydrogenase [Thermoflexales bacterium]|nr:D-2-hydroxyacid dehydrogenase [Thermoflexales bacterium]
MSILLMGFEPAKLHETQRERIQQAAPDMQVLVIYDQAEIEAVLDEIEIAACNFPHDLIAKAPRLRWFQQWSAGADWLLRYPKMVELDFVLTSTSGMHATQVTEHIMAFLLAFARQLHVAIHVQLSHTWIPQSQQVNLFELAGKTMLLVGVGEIGRQTAQLAAAFGMRVLGIQRTPGASMAGVEAMFAPHQLRQVLPQADVVVLLAPLTRETRGMIGEEELRAMKPSTYLINVGRGGLVQEGALIRALREGWIAGAGLDVFESEPLPVRSPLWDMENVIITSHYAGATPHYDERALEIFLDNLRRYRAGLPLCNVVDKKMGY